MYLFCFTCLFLIPGHVASTSLHGSWVSEHFCGEQAWFGLLLSGTPHPDLRRVRAGRYCPLLILAKDLVLDQRGRSEGLKLFLLLGNFFLFRLY